MSRQYCAIGYVLGQCRSSKPENDFVHFIYGPQFKGMPEDSDSAEVNFEDGSIKFLDSNSELLEEFDLVAFVQTYSEPLNSNYEDWVSEVYKLGG